MHKLSENLKNIRANKKILQKNIAKDLNIPLRTYQSYEYGESEPNIETLINIADYLEIDLDSLVGRSDTSNIV